MTNINQIALLVWQNYLFKTALLLFLVAVSSYIIKSLLIWLLQKYFARMGLFKGDIAIERHFHPSLWLILILLGFNLFQPLAEIPEAYTPVIDKTWQIVLILTLTYFMIRMVNFLKLIILEKFDTSVKNNLQQRKVVTQVDFAERLIAAFLVVIGFCMILLSFEGARKIGTSLIASAGLAGIVVGFAAQKTLSNLIAGFQIAFTQPFRIDDVVIVEGEWGWIEEITLTYVVVRVWDKRRLVVPINYLLEKPFQNWTRTDSEILGYVYIYADYSVPLDKLRKEFHRLLEKTDLWNGKVANVQVTNSTEKTQEIRFLVSTDDSGRAWDLRCYLREHLIRFMQENFPESLPKYRIDALEKRESYAG